MRFTYEFQSRILNTQCVYIFFFIFTLPNHIYYIYLHDKLIIIRTNISIKNPKISFFYVSHSAILEHTYSHHQHCHLPKAKKKSSSSYSHLKKNTKTYTTFPESVYSTYIQLSCLYEWSTITSKRKKNSSHATHIVANTYNISALQFFLQKHNLLNILFNLVLQTEGELKFVAHIRAYTYTHKSVLLHHISHFHMQTFIFIFV